MVGELVPKPLAPPGRIPLGLKPLPPEGNDVMPGIPIGSVWPGSGVDDVLLGEYLPPGGMTSPERELPLPPLGCNCGDG